MRVCRVIGQVVSTVKHPVLMGRTILVILPSEGRGDPAVPMQLAVDGVGARRGDEVIVGESGAAGSEVTGVDYPPIRSVIVGIVD